MANKKRKSLKSQMALHHARVIIPREAERWKKFGAICGIAFVLILIIGLVAAMTGCAAKKPMRPPATYVFSNCRTVDEVYVSDHHTGEQHVELTCTCEHRAEKLDSKTNRVIVDCQ